MFLPQLTRYLDIKELKGKYIQIRNSLYRIARDWCALYWWSPLPCWHISCQPGQINMESEALLCLGQASTGSRKADSNFIAIISKIFIRSDIFSSRDTRLSIPSCKCPAGCGVRVCDVHWVSSLAQLRAWWLLTGGWPWTESSHPLTAHITHYGTWRDSAAVSPDTPDTPDTPVLTHHQCDSDMRQVSIALWV